MKLTDTATKAEATLSGAQQQVKDLGLAAGEKLDSTAADVRSGKWLARTPVGTRFWPLV
jgi:hypothetical protein